jgi:ABC-2 type transport system permease protein
MSWQAIARKDFQDALRSRWLLALTTLFVLLVSAGVYFVRPASGQTVSSNAVVNSIVVKDGFVTSLVPLISLVMAYAAVVKERESGSLKLLLSLPHSRGDVVLGKVLGRSAAIATPIFVGFLLPGLVLALLPRVTFRPGYYLGFTALTAVLATVFVAIAVGFSSAVSSQRFAIGGAIAIYFLFVPLWIIVRAPLQLFLGLGGGPSWLPISGSQLLDLLRLINPSGSFKIVTNSFMAGSLFASADGVPSPRLQIAAVAMLAAWALVPPLLGLWRFEGADL